MNTWSDATPSKPPGCGSSEILRGRCRRRTSARSRSAPGFAGRAWRRGRCNGPLRLPPGSRLRKAMLERFARTAFLSWNRGDYALVPVMDDPEVEVHFTVNERIVVGS